MTKSKRQLRAEAVERLRNTDSICYSDWIKAIVGETFKKNWFEEDKADVIDLLSDDAPMTNIEWLYENDRKTLTQMFIPCEEKSCSLGGNPPTDGALPPHEEPCPLDGTEYCDLMYLLPKDFAEWLMAEHTDAGMRPESGCSLMREPADDALLGGDPHALGGDNAADALLDADGCQDDEERDEGDCDDLDGHGGDLSSGSPIVPQDTRKKTKGRRSDPSRPSELSEEEPLGFVSSGGNLCDGDYSTNTREKLEADVFKAMKGSVENGWLIGFGTIGDWLDRQASITRRECADKCAEQLDEFLATDERLRDMRDSLLVENAKLQVKVDELTEERDRYKELYLDMSWHSGHQRMELAKLNARLNGYQEPQTKLVGKDGKPIRRGQTLYGQDGRAWKVERFDGTYLWTEDDGKRLKPEWLAHEKPSPAYEIAQWFREGIDRIESEHADHGQAYEVEMSRLFEECAGRFAKLVKEGKDVNTITSHNELFELIERRKMEGGA